MTDVIESANSRSAARGLGGAAPQKKRTSPSPGRGQGGGDPHRWACILGQPVHHSLSPALHNAAFVALGLDARYEAREVAPEQVREAVAALRESACYGANVTAPHKQAVMPFLDEIAPSARVVGAVNTIVQTGGRLRGENTDVDGLQRWMAAAGLVPGGNAVVLGAGGAARAAVLALARRGADSIRVLNRTPARAEALVDALRPEVGSARLLAGSLAEAEQAADVPAAIVVNATSLGHQGQTPSVHPSWFGRGSVGVDLAYNPPETPFMALARSAGARAENGLGMLLHQAVLAFELWTGQVPPLRVYEDAAADALRQPTSYNASLRVPGPAYNAIRARGPVGLVQPPSEEDHPPSLAGGWGWGQ